jgi:phosphatidylserine decarboxylase
VGQSVARGERFGMIRFGSRTEVYLPLDAEILVKVGDRVQSGVSIIARLPSPT